jgi:hypothetical protein
MLSCCHAGQGPWLFEGKVMRPGQYEAVTGRHYNGTFNAVFTLVLPNEPG